MKAMILGAGKGTRVWPVTKTIPKPMISILGKPLMESIIEHFKSFDITEIIVNTSHLAPVIEDYFRTGQQLGVDISYSYEGELIDGSFTSCPIGSAGGMKKVQEFSGFFDETFVVVCGDAIVDVDFDAVLKFHKEKKSIATIVMKDVSIDEVHKYGVVKTDKNGKISQFQEKPQAEDAVSTSINAGIYVFEPEIFNYIPKDIEFDIGGELFPKLVEEDLPFYGITLDYQWVDVGSLTDIWETTKSILSGEVKNYPIPGKEIEPGFHIGINTSIDIDKTDIQGPVVIGNGTRIGNNVQIVGPAVIGNNCVIEDGAIIKHCIVDDYTWVSSIACLENKVLFGGHCINNEGESVELSELDLGWIINDSRNNTKGDDDGSYSEIYELAKTLPESV